MVIIYRGDETKRIEPEVLQDYAAQGWTTRKPGTEPPRHDGGPVHVGDMHGLPGDATPLEAQAFVLGKMHIQV